MKMYRNNLLASSAYERATNSLICVTDNFVFLDRDLVWSDDHGGARPEKSVWPDGATGDWIR